MGGDSVTVYPLSFGGVATEPEHLKDLPAVDVGMAILRQATFKPANPSGARDGVESESPNRAGVVAVDGESHGVVCCVSTIQDQGSLVGKHCEMCINHKIDHLIGGRHVETIAEPIDCQVSRCHGIEQEVLQVLLGLGVGKESGFVHVSTIHGLGCCAHFVCHLANWSPRPISLYQLSVVYSISITSHSYPYSFMINSISA